MSPVSRSLTSEDRASASLYPASERVEVSPRPPDRSPPPEHAPPPLLAVMRLPRVLVEEGSAYPSGTPDGVYVSLAAVREILGPPRANLRRH